MSASPVPSGRRRSGRRLLLVLFLLMIAVSIPAGAEPGHGHDRDKIRLTSIADEPDPFSPPLVARLSAITGIRKVDGLGAREKDDDADCDEDRAGRRDHRKSFLVVVHWTIRSAGAVVARIDRSVEVQGSLSFAKLSTQVHPGGKKFALIPVESTWDARTSSGLPAGPGTYDYEVVADFVRIHEHGFKTRLKLIDTSEPLNGSVTIGGGTPPVLLVNSPVEGQLTRDSSITVAGSVTGASPIAVKVNGTSVPTSNGALSSAVSLFSSAVSLAEGIGTIVVGASNALGTAEVTRHVRRDSTPPTLAISAPPAGTTTVAAEVQFVVEYTDPGGSGIDIGSFTADLDGSTVTVYFSVASDRATLSPTSPLAAGSHVLVARISDVAGNQSSATSTFTIDAKPQQPSVDPFPVTNIPLITLTGGKPANTSILVDGVERVPSSASTTWTTTKTLTEGVNVLSLVARSLTGLDSDPVVVSLTLDSVPPLPPSLNPPPTDVTSPAITLSGTKAAGTAVLINGVVAVPLDGSTMWSASWTLVPGANHFLVETQDAAGNRSITEGGKVARISRTKPVIGNLTVVPPIAPTGQTVVIGYTLFAAVPSVENADFQVTVTVEDGDHLVRTVFSGVQRGSPAGTPCSVSWDQRSDAGLLVDVNTSYRILVSAERVNPTTEPAEVANANPKESAVTVTGSQKVTSPDGKLRVIFRPDDATMVIRQVSVLTARQSAVLAARRIRLLERPYLIGIDRPFTSSVAALFRQARPAARFLRPYMWNDSQQDWLPVPRSTWNPVEATLGFALPGPGLVLIGSGPDAEPPRIAAVTTPPGSIAIRVADRGSGINPARTRVRCRGVDITRSATSRNLNGSREQLVTTSDAGVTVADLAIYLEDWAGNGRIYRLKGAGR